MFLPSRHLLGTGRRPEARSVIAALNSVPEDDALVDELVGELDFAIHAENDGGKATWAECFSSRNNLWKRTVNGMMLQFIQQLNGQNFYCKPTGLEVMQVTYLDCIIDYYGDTFFQSAGTEYALQADVIISLLRILILQALALRNSSHPGRGFSYRHYSSPGEWPQSPRYSPHTSDCCF